jgi:tRNA(Ile)-lysidine synthase
LPEIEKLSTDFPVSIDKSLEYLSEDELLLKYTIEEKKRTIFSIKNKQIIISKNELFTLENSKTWLFYLIKDFGFNRSIVNEIYSAMMNEKVGKIFFSDKKQLLINRGNLIIREKAIKIHTARKWHLRKRSISVPLKLKPKVVKKTDEYNMQNDPAFAYFDFEKLTFPLLIRRWKEGDHFFPFGMKGSKLVSDFLIDQKIDLFEKENIYVMLSGNEIIWVIGKRSSDKFRVSGQTRKIYQVQLIDDKNA